MPPEHVMGYGPRLSALMAELAGTYGNGRRMVQTFCSSVLGIPVSLVLLCQILSAQSALNCSVVTHHTTA